MNTTYTRHREVPVFEFREGIIEAAHYNHVQVAFKRLGDGLRLALPGLKTLELILQRDAWVVVDRAFNEIPVVAWTDFETEHRTALHVPVRCRVRLYHANAGLILKRVLESMDRILNDRLEAQLSEAPDRVRVIGDDRGGGDT